MIIWPEEKPRVTLVPPTPRLGPSFGRARAENPLSIPFFGVYWIYRPPDKQPPPDSLVLRGSPADRRLRSTDRVHLNMEARQNLGALFPIDCCSAVELILDNADRYFGTVTIELLLRDTSSKP